MNGPVLAISPPAFIGLAGSVSPVFNAFPGLNAFNSFNGFNAVDGSNGFNAVEGFPGFNAFNGFNGVDASIAAARTAAAVPAVMPNGHRSGAPKSRRNVSRSSRHRMQLYRLVQCEWAMKR
jgi:hypothetical protein